MRRQALCSLNVFILCLISTIFLARSFRLSVLRSLRPRYSVSLSCATKMSSSVARFLKERTPPPPGSTLRIYIGNEAADADSIVSALCSAYLCNVAETVDSSSRTHLPLVNLPRADLRFRPDVNMILSQASLTVEDLVSADEVQWAQLQVSKIVVALLDHNSIHPRIQRLLEGSGIPWEVCMILDHHLDQKQFLDAPVRDVAFDAAAKQQLAGSACSLVHRHFASLYPDLWNPVNSAGTQEISKLLLSVVLLDTYSAEPQHRKNTVLDDAAVRALAPLAGYSLGVVEREGGDCLDTLSSELLSWYQTVSSAKFEYAFWHQLQPDECLRYDFKEFSLSVMDPVDDRLRRIGISSVLLPLQELLNHANFPAAVHAYLGAEKSQIFAVMGLLKPGTGCEGVTSLRRQLCVLSANVAIVDSFLRFARENHDCESDLMSPAAVASSPKSRNLRLRLIEGFILRVSDGVELHGLLFEQGDTAASRKQVAPLLTDEFAPWYLML